VDRRGFHPEIEPYHTGRLRVSELHELHFEEVGSPDGKPVVFLHGGPGAGLIPLYRQAFDPRAYRVVLFHQRGCGRSTPLGELGHAFFEPEIAHELVTATDAYAARKD
jgi:proline iminopeptidase